MTTTRTPPGADLCDAVAEALLLGRALDAAARAHVDGCDACRQARALLPALAQTLADDPAPVPAELAARVQRATAPLLARNARRAVWWSLARAVGVSLLPLPLLLAIDAYLLRTAYAWLSTVLPGALSLYLVVEYTALVALMLTLTYGAIPLLTERQLRLQREESSWLTST